MSGEQVKCFMTGEDCARPDRKEVISKKVFVIMPFKDKYYDNFNFGIERYYSNNEYDCRYGALSHYMKGEYVICNICGELQSSKLVVADVSEENPNVYYELGMSHGLGKETIILNNDSCNKNLIIKLLKEAELVSPYSNIRKINKVLSTTAGKNFLISNEGIINNDNSHSLNIACLVPFDLPNQPYNEKPKFSEVFKIAIKDSIRKIDLLRQRNINVDEMKNIICKMKNIFCDASCRVLSEKQTFAEEIIKYIMNTCYFIIDFTGSRPEVLYWLGFIHGLRLNRNIDMVKEATYIYIAREDSEKLSFEKLPFDIRANRIILYKSLKDLSEKISVEIEKLEKNKIHNFRLNQAKYKFWHHFNFRNTTFIFGSDCMSREEAPKEHTLTVSAHDFKAFNRLTYIILFLQEQRQLRYDIKIKSLLDFISRKNQNNYKKLEQIEIEVTSTSPCLKTIYRDMHKFSDKEALERCGFNNNDNNNDNKENNGNKKNYIIIGPSYVNMVTEIIFRSLYDDKNSFNKKINDMEKHYGYTFKTVKEYKLKKSRFWKNVRNDKEKIQKIDNTIGIYLPKDNNSVSFESKIDDLCPICEYVLFDEIENKKEQFVLKKDFGLLLFFNNLKIFKSKIQGNFIVLCGFSKYGTYGLGRMISNYIIDENDCKCKEEEICLKEEKSNIAFVNDLLSMINKIINEENEYCIEVVIEFENKNFKDEFGENFVEDATKTLMEFKKYNRKDHTREDLMDSLKELIKKRQKATCLVRE